jgi:hypothetical protein
MERVLRVTMFGSKYQVYDVPRLEDAVIADTEKECADAITDYRQRHPGTPVEFEKPVSRKYKARISKLARI